MSHQRKSKIVTPKDEWGTPQWLFDLLDKEFRFALDAAATENNTKAYYYNNDSLNQDWLIPRNKDDGGGYFAVFLNPPYSAGNIDRFMQKAYEESQKGAVVICLVPCATDTRWWHNYAMKAQEIRFIKGRVRFVGYDEDSKQVANSPTFSSCVVIFKHDPGKDYRIDMPWIGKTINQPLRDLKKKPT